MATSRFAFVIPASGFPRRICRRFSRRSSLRNIAGPGLVSRSPATSWKSTTAASVSKARSAEAQHSPWSSPMPKTKVLIIDDEKLVRWSLQQKLSKEGYEVESAPTGEEGLNLIREDGYDLVLLDLRLPGMDGLQTLREIKKLEREIGVVMLTADTGLAQAVECVRLGAHNYLTKPFEFDQVKVALEKAREDLKLRREVTRLRRQQQKKHLVGESPQIRTLREFLAKRSESDATTVLIEGENGTGKELAAQAIHAGSARANQPFLAINCSAIPENLIESELFGHERGAFTDAKSLKKGLFELADGGTVLLDGIGDMQSSFQAKLWR